MIKERSIYELMTPDPVTLRAEDTVRTAAILMMQHGIDGLPVVDEERRVLGMVTKSHVLEVFLSGGDTSRRVDGIMRRSVITVDPTLSFYEVCNLPAKRLPVVDGGGQLIGMVTKTDLIRAFSADVRMIKERLTTIIESATNAIVAVDRSGIIFTFNSAAERIVGVPAQEAIGKYIHEVIPTSGLINVLASGESQTGIKIKIGEKTVITNCSPLMKDGQIIGAVGIFQDVSELEKVSRELDSYRELSEELNAIIESSYDGICVADGDGVITRVNTAYEKLLGISREEVVGTSLGLLHDLVAREQEPVSIIQRTPTGKQVIFTGNPVTGGDGKMVKMVANARDITELDRLRKELEETKELTERYSTELEHLRRQQTLPSTEVVASSARMKKVLELAMRVAQVDSTVLLLGESGVGKEVLAKVIHSYSARSCGPFIKLNCAAIPEQLLESELFGYEYGAFTGARRQGKPGFFELAQKGTLFLDEIAELPLNLQAKLLRVLQEQEFTRVGGVTPIRVDTRILAASNQDLEELIEEGRFRKDLYYRLNVVPLVVPPLRERKEDIPLLAYHFLKRYNQQFNMNKKFAPGVIDRLLDYDWPGNVRELGNVIERLVVMTSGGMITEADLPQSLAGNRTREANYYNQETGEVRLMPLREAVDDLERKLIAKALDKYGSARKAAEVLGIDASTVVRKLHRLKAQ